MATPSAISTKETTNYARVCRLLVDFGTWALRNKFDSIHPPGNLFSILAAPGTKNIIQSLYTGRPKIINSSQITKLYQTTPSGLLVAPVPTVSSSDFDTTLLTVLLRNICNLKPPSKGWDQPPSASDTSPEANIVRIKYCRNKVYAHAEKASIDDAIFHTIWTDIQDPLVRLGVKKTDIDTLKTECIDPVAEKKYTDLVKQMIEDDKELWEKIENLAKMTEDKFNEMDKKFDDKLDGVEERLMNEMKKNQDDASRDKGIVLESELPKKPVDVHGHTMEVDSIVKILTDDSTKDVAVVLVSGMPGVGKSTVSIQAGHKLKDDFDRIVKFCSLRDTHPTKDDEGERVLREILSKCQADHHPTHEKPKLALRSWCRRLEQDLVLVLDNAEDALEDSFKDSFVGLLTEMRTCSKEKIKFIITSRRTDIESTAPDLTVKKVTVKPLKEEDSIQVLKGRLQVDSDVSREDLGRVAGLCEYIPMALHLASPLLSSDSEYSVDKLIHDLAKHPTRILKCPVILEIAFEKLTEPLRRSLIRLSVFGRSFERKAAEALLGDDCADHLMQLKERCFIQKRDNRYILHLLIRSYARTIGAKKFPVIWNQGQQVFDEHFLAMILENAKMHMCKDKCKVSFDLFNEERLNYESLLRDVSGKKIKNCKALRDAVRGCRKLAPYVEFCVPVKLYEDFLNGLLHYVQKQNETVHEVEILCLLYYEGRKQGWAKKHAKGLMDIASKLFEENRRAFKTNVPLEVFYLSHYGRYQSQDCNERNKGQDCLKEALSICESYEKETSELIPDKGAILAQMGHNAKCQERKDEAHKCYSQALEFYQALYGHHVLTAFAHKDLADYYLNYEDLSLAEENYKKAIDIMKLMNKAEHKEAIPTYKNMGICFEKSGMFDESRETYEKGSEVADNTIEGNHKWKVWIKTYLALLLHSKYPDDIATAVRIAKDVLEMGRQLELTDWPRKEALEELFQTH